MQRRKLQCPLLAVLSFALALALALALSFSFSFVPSTAFAAAPDFSRYRHAPPRGGRGPVRIATKPWSDDIDPARAGTPWSSDRRLLISAAPGETEPATFVVYARSRVRRLGVKVGRFDGPAGTLPAGAATVREVRRTPTRISFGRPDTKVVGRFLPRLEPRPLAAGHLREIWIDVTVPPDAAPGHYSAEVTLDVDGKSIVRTLATRVRRVRLVEPETKRLAMYYRAFAAVGRPEVMRGDLADMREHGVRHLVTDLRPTFARRAGAGGEPEIHVDTTVVAEGLALISAVGFRGTVVVGSGFVPLARTMGHADVGYRDATGASLAGEGGEAFGRLALHTLQALARLAKSHPELDIAVSHLDEIFGRDRLDLFLRFAELSRDVPELPVFAAFSTMSDAEENMRRRVDPYVDLRANHGYTFEWWIVRGRDWGEYASELARSKDRAWFYHNARGTYFTPVWSRLVNGIYLWAGPFESHLTWVYQQFDGDPFDDTDGVVHDFGVAFPDPSDPSVLIPTRSWAAVREGWDDLRYLETLEVAIERHGAAAPTEAAAAVTFLGRLRADVLRTPYAVDIGALPSRIGSAGEAPYLQSLAQRYDAPTLAAVRERAEELTVVLQTAGGGSGR